MVSVLALYDGLYCIGKQMSALIIISKESVCPIVHGTTMQAQGCMVGTHTQELSMVHSYSGMYRDF